MIFTARGRHHARFAAEAAVIAWLAVILNDWHESTFTRPKGSMYTLILVGSLPCLVLGVALAVRARKQLVEDVRAQLTRDGALPPPLWVLTAGIRRGLVAALLNVVGYFGIFFSHPLRIASSFLLAGIVGGAWLARSVIVREYPEKVARSWALAVAVIPAAMLATVATSMTLVVVRMSLDNAVLWAFTDSSLCGGVEVGNASIALLPTTVLLTTGLALAILVTRRATDTLGDNRVARTVLGMIFVGVACVAFADIIESVLLALVPRGCRNTPYRSPLSAMAFLRSMSFMRTVLFASGGLGGALASLLLLVAGRRVSSPAQPMSSELGPYRSPPSS